MSALRKYYRIILFIPWLLLGIVLTVLFQRNTRKPHGFATNVASKWLGVLLRIFGIRIKIVGKSLPTKTLFVANHISWLDTLILGHLLHIHFLSKHEVKTMPIFGWLATRAGTLYIKRGKRNSASESSSEITNVLNQQHNSLIFAEGTTTDGNLKKFHSRMMQSAIDAKAMVQPVAIFYPTTDTTDNPSSKSLTKNTELNPVVLFIDDMSIGTSFDKVIRAASTNVEVHFLKPINSSNASRNEIAQHAYEEVQDAIISIKKRIE